MAYLAFVDETEVDRIAFGEEDWVDIKRKMAYGTRERLVDDQYKFQLQIKKGTQDMDVDIRNTNIMLLVFNIVAWSLCDKKGAPVIVSEKAIRSFDEQVAWKLLEEIGKRNPVDPKA